MRERPVGVKRPAVCTARREHAGVLAGAIVTELPLRTRLLQTVFQVVDTRFCACQQRAHRSELCGLRLMRRARDRELLVSEIGVALEERNRLHRLQGRAEEAVEIVAVRVAGRRADVHAVHRLDRASSPHGYPDRVHRRRRLLTCLSCQRSRRGAASSTRS